ncbi:hypothetical protein GK091_25575 [Spirosoma agri]|uniref:Pesticidal crystal protein domain-containing protein n=1 Tax=Spirosoma agri TaxID=1987381 RepID=A0A6M0IT12_9BACT|nr:insecticidal delta-endotoxin Cry8Ea1 family protein [Spirosoma agri]NEU70273.1 hypothetical protein [Spirosoma agri]
MFSPKSLTNRRQFLERTALGAGSVLFLPGLLASCTDHRIPDPGVPAVVPPVVGSDAIDWNDDAKAVVVAGLGLIPGAGSILSGLIAIFWPGTDVWSQVKDRVEAFVNQKIADLVYQQAQDDLKGLHNLLTRYLNELKHYNDSVTAYQKDSTKPVPDPTDLRTQWLRTIDLFTVAIPHFQSTGYEVVLLGLFAQLANMYLALLREGVVNGKSWGRSDGDHQQDITDLKKCISDFLNYTLTTYTNHLSTLAQTIPKDQPNEPFATLNRFNREITLTALDYMNIWPYYDVTKFPKGGKVSLLRELYSDPLGDNTNSGPINLVFPSPTQSPIQLTIWGTPGLQNYPQASRINAIQLTYPAGSGPGGVTTTPRMGFQGNMDGFGHEVTSNAPNGGRLDIAPNNPIVSATTSYYEAKQLYGGGQYYIQSMQFVFRDRSFSPVIGGVTNNENDPHRKWQTVFLTDHFISRIHVNGAGDKQYGADCVVYGLKYLTGGPSVSARALGILYVTSPQELSGADLAQASSAYSLSDALITDNLKAARQAYWVAIEARAAALK